jgi:hypothetical protein
VWYTDTLDPEPEPVLLVLEEEGGVVESGGPMGNEVGGV